MSRQCKVFILALVLGLMLTDFIMLASIIASAALVSEVIETICMK